MNPRTVSTEPSQVIVFQDDNQLRQSTLNALVMEGFNAVGTGSADDFFRQLGLRPSLVALIDVDTPAHNGLDLIGVVRKKSAARIVALTTSNSPSDRLACIKAGADVCLLKPVNFMLLSATVGVLLQRRGRQDSVLNQHQIVSQQLKTTHPHDKSRSSSADCLTG